MIEKLFTGTLSINAYKQNSVAKDGSQGLKMGKCIAVGAVVILAGNEDNHESSDKFDFGLDRTIHF